jgi:hypothetical protein
MLGQIIKPAKKIRREKRLHIPSSAGPGCLLKTEAGTENLDCKNLPQMGDGHVFLLGRDPEAKPLKIRSPSFLKLGRLEVQKPT